MSFIPNIFLVGEVSSGKSSFLNSLASGFVSCVSLQRETFAPLHYEFRKKGTEEDLNKITISMEEMHSNNQKQREQFGSNIKGVLPKKEEPIKYKLPVRHGLQEMNIIDFPGLNDSEDTNNTFMKVLEENIHDAHMIMFITDAEKAFSNASELDTYNKIKKCIENEYEKNYHFIDLIIVVNKYDEIKDSDIRQIYGRIADKVKSQKDKLFRVSSHKLFVHSIVDRKGYMFIPKFLKTESQKILKNSNVSMNGLTKRFNTKLQYWKLNHGDLKFNDECVDETSSDEEDSIETIDCKLVGDWDNLIEYVQSFNNVYFKKCSDELRGTLSDTCKNIVELYELMWGSSFDKTDNHIQKLTVYISTLNHIIEQLKLKKNNMAITYLKIMELVNEILNYSNRCSFKGPFRLLIVEILFNMISDSTFRIHILEAIIDDKMIDKISNTTILSLMRIISVDKALMVKFWNNPNGRKKIISLLSDSENYGVNIPFSPCNQSYYYENKQFIKTCFRDETKPNMTANWFITRMITSLHVPPELRYTILISITDKATLQKLYIDNEINTAYLDKCKTELSLKLKLHVCIISQGSSFDSKLSKFEHQLFTLDDNVNVKQAYNNYKNTKDLLKELF